MFFNYFNKLFANRLNLWNQLKMKYFKSPDKQYRSSEPPNKWWRNSLLVVMGFLFIGIMATERFAYAQDVPFDVSIKLSWNEYAMTTQSFSASIGSCDDTTKYYNVNVPVTPQNIPLTKTESDHKNCHGSTTGAEYRISGGSWIGVTNGAILNYQGGQLDFRVRAGSSRYHLKCRGCDVNVGATFYGGKPTPREIPETISYSISSDQIIPVQVDIITIPPSSGNTVPKNAKCEVTSANDDVKVSCEQRVDGFALIASIDNEAPTVSIPSPALATILEESAARTLSWLSSDPENDPLSYNVYFGGELICENITVTECVVPTDKLSFGTKYVWYVEVKDEYQTTTGAVWNFSIRDNLPPEPPVYTAPSPDNATIDIVPTQELIVSYEASTDPDNDDVFYRLCRQKDGEDTLFCTPQEPSANTTLTIPANALEFGTPYNWWVEAKDQVDGEFLNLTLGETRTFTTEEAPVELFLEAKSGYANTLLEWDISNNTDVVSYRVLRNGNPILPVAEAPNVSFIDDDNTLIAGTEYCYVVEALDVNDISLYQSNQSCATSGVTSLAIKNIGALKEETVNVPIIIPNAGNLQVSASDIWLRFDSNVISYEGVSKTALTNDYSVTSNLQDDVDSMKIVRISVEYNGSEMNPPPIQGEGPLVDVAFKAIGNSGDSSTLELIPFVIGQGGSTMYDHEDNEISLNLSGNNYNIRRVRDGQASSRFYVGEAYVTGDVNGNGTPQTVDARIVRKIGIGRTIPTSEQKTAGDINGDGLVNAADANMIVHYVLNQDWPGVTVDNTRSRLRDGRKIIISVDNIEGESGNEVQTTLYFENLSDLSSMNIAVVYDNNVIERIVSVERTGLATDAMLMFADDGNGTLNISIDSQTTISGSGAFAIITLQLASDGDTRTKPLSIAKAHLYDNAGRDFVISALQRELTAHHGTVTRIDKPVIPVIEEDGETILLKDYNQNPETTEPIEPTDNSNSIVIQDNENTLVVTLNDPENPVTKWSEGSNTPDLPENVIKVGTGTYLVDNNGGKTVVDVEANADGSFTLRDPDNAENVVTVLEDGTLIINDPVTNLQATFDNTDNMQAVDTTEPNIVLDIDSEGNVNITDLTLPEFIATLNEDASITGIDTVSGVNVTQDQEGQQVVTHPDFPGMQAVINADNTLSITDIEIPEIVGIFNPQDGTYQIIDAINGFCYDDSASNIRGGFWKKLKSKVKSFIGKAAKFVNKISSKVIKVASFVSKAAGIVSKVSGFITKAAPTVLNWATKVLNWACKNCHPIIANVASKFVSLATTGSNFLNLANKVTTWSGAVGKIADTVVKVSSNISKWSQRLMNWSGIRRALRRVRDGGQPVIQYDCNTWDPISGIGGILISDGDYTTHGTIRDEAGNPIADITIQIGGQTVTTDAAGNWEIDSLPTGEYTAIATKDGLTFIPVDFEVGNNQLLNQIKLKALNDVKARIATKIRGQKAEQGKNITYVITVVNGSDKLAINNVVTYKIPTGTELVRIQGMGEVTCNGIVCNLPDLPVGASSEIEVELNIGQISSTLVNQVTLTSNDLSTDVAKSWTRAKPYLSIFGKATPSPVTMGGTLHYMFDIELNDNVPYGEATGINLTVTLPKELRLESTPANCDISNFPVISCPIENLSVETSEDTSKVTISIDTLVEEPGLIKLITKAEVTSDNYVAHSSKVRAEVDTGGVEVDGVIVMDVTNSMGDQLNAIIRQVKQLLIDGFADGATPLIAVVTFRDEDDIKLVAATRNLETLLEAVESLEAKDGGMCPEASADALLLGLSHLKQKGTLIFVTDAPPYDDAETQATLEQIKQLLIDKEINSIPIMTEVNCDGGN